MCLSKEGKRPKSETACAECRRLKARCDKQVPCSTCVKRGCQMLCPNSTMPPGDCSRFVSTAEQFLRQKITKMEERMHSLEDALVIVQSTGSCKQNIPPNLSAGLSGSEMEWPPQADYDQITDDFNKCGLAEALGSLYLGGEGQPSDEPICFGTTGNSESLLLQARVFVTESPSLSNHGEETDFSYFPPEVNSLHQAFPFTPPRSQTRRVQDVLESYLPPHPRAIALCETFLQSITFIVRVVSRQYILGELVPVIYRRSGDQISAEPRPYGPHDISLLFIVFAISTLVDSSLPSYSVEGQRYQVLSRAALCLQPVFSEHSVVTIKALNLMSIYDGMCGLESKLEESFSLLNLAALIALQIGLHKDPFVWGITGREAYERRTYFWNLVHGTLWQSLISGRPPTIMPSVIACHMPTEEEEEMYQFGEAPLGFGIWCFSFIIECVAPVVEVVQATRRSTYDAVLALDDKIRKFSIPQAPDSKQITGQRQDLEANDPETALLFLHRGFFAQALADFPWDPLKSPFRHSFLTAYQSAVGVLGSTRDQFVHHPLMYARICRVWTYAFSAAVVIAAVAIKRLPINLKPEPFGELDRACELFHEAARMSVRAQKALPILLRLRQEAMQIRLETLPTESGNLKAVSRGTRDATSGMPGSGVSSTASSKYMHALPVPVVHPPLARIDEFDAESRADADGTQASLGPQDLYREIQIPPSTAGSTSHGSPRALYITHSSAHDIDQWTSFVGDCSGKHANS